MTSQIPTALSRIARTEALRLHVVSSTLSRSAARRGGSESARRYTSTSPGATSTSLIGQRRPRQDLQWAAKRVWSGSHTESSAFRDGMAAGQRSFSSTPSPRKDHHFDTLKFVQRLKDEGFTEEQAVAIMTALSDVIEESILNLTRIMVLREDAEKATYTQKVDFAKLRSELSTSDSTESSLTRTSHERLTNELAKLNARLRDEVQRTLASVRLDLNLEKGRIREESNAQELKIKETEARIEQETAVLREKLEQIKLNTLQWLTGVCIGTAAMMLGLWRLLM